ncbi:MAG: hypothetical protein R2932_18240 [Caldilineaceae bacterium]
MQMITNDDNCRQGQNEIAEGYENPRRRTNRNVEAQKAVWVIRVCNRRNWHPNRGNAVTKKAVVTAGRAAGQYPVDGYGFCHSRSRRSWGEM